MTVQAGQEGRQEKPGRVEMSVRRLDVTYQNLHISFTMSQQKVYGKNFKITKIIPKHSSEITGQHSLFQPTAHLQAYPQVSFPHGGNDSRIASFRQNGWCHSAKK